MAAYVITLRGHDYSERVADRCISSAEQYGVRVTHFPAVSADEAVDVMEAAGLRWTWAHDNSSHAVCPYTGLKQHPYGRLPNKIGCSMSHYLLWERCVELDEPLLILEHDAVFIGPLPDVEWHSVCQINDPTGATPRGAWWAESMRSRGPGVWPKTRVRDDPLVPDGLAGNSAYLIQPHAAAELMQAFRTYGVWPNDATMCVQLFPDLQELYPFVTKVDQAISTTTHDVRTQ